MPEAITNNLDVWTSALLTKSTAGRGSNGKLEAYGIKKLRELILELAVRGKLVPQDANDEPASELLKEIAAEKVRLLKAGRIKKGNLPAIADDEIPNQLPPCWEWVRLGEYVYLEMGQSPSSDFYNQEMNGLPFFQGKADFGDVYPTPRYWCIQPQKFSYPGDVLLSVRAPVGPTNISNIECCIGRGLAALRPLANASTQYLLILMRAFQERLASLATGTTFGAVSKNDIESLVVCVPPLAEQHRIVAKVDELMALCDQLEKKQTDSLAAHQTLVETLLGTLTRVESQQEFSAAWSRIASHFDTLFTTEASIDQLKQTLLQLAVMGKLVPQDPNDESASALLKRIQAEKAKLIAEGKIKKDKPLPEITEDEKPFELPQGWKWARFPELGEFGRGKSKHRPRNEPKLFNPGIYPLVQTGEVARAGNVIDEYHSKYSEAGLAQSKMWPAGTLCITIAANIADSAMLGFDACFPDSVVGFVPCEPLSDTRYFLAFMKTARENLLKFAPSTAQKNINLEILESVLIPLPPLKEIFRIVAKVDELMALCDALKARLADAQAIQIHLADAIVEQTVC